MDVKKKKKTQLTDWYADWYDWLIFLPNDWDRPFV